VLTDQEAAEREQDATALLKVFLTAKQWLIVCDRNERAELLEIVECGDVNRIKASCYERYGFDRRY
jgi:hypothetical protein